MMQTYRDLKLPADLWQTTEEKLVGSVFKNMEELICFLLQELVREDALQINADEERVIEERLRSLGYL